MVQYSNFDRTMEASHHFTCASRSASKKGASSKRQMNGRFFLRTWTEGLIFVLIIIGLVSCQMNQKEIPYLSTKLSPYSDELGIVPSSLPKSFFQAETYAKLETGLDDFQVHTGIGKQGNHSGYWMQIETTFMLTSLKKDESLNICRDTIRHKFSGDTTMITFELIHHLSTDEIQYIWLDADNNRSEKAIIINIDHPLRAGKMFPNLTVEQLNGGKLSFNELIGKTVVVNWWHTGCGPCIAEMPGFNKLVEQYKENSNVVFVAIAHNKKDDVARFLESREFNYIQTLANENAVKLFKDSYPVNLIINSEGKICDFSRGGHENKYLEIEKVLNGLLE